MSFDFHIIQRSGNVVKRRPTGKGIIGRRAAELLTLSQTPTPADALIQQTAVSLDREIVSAGGTGRSATE